MRCIPATVAFCASMLALPVWADSGVTDLLRGAFTACEVAIEPDEVKAMCPKTLEFVEDSRGVFLKELRGTTAVRAYKVVATPRNEDTRPDLQILLKLGQICRNEQALCGALSQDLLSALVKLPSPENGHDLEAVSFEGWYAFVSHGESDLFPAPPNGVDEGPTGGPPDISFEAVKTQEGMFLMFKEWRFAEAIVIHWLAFRTPERLTSNLRLYR